MKTINPLLKSPKAWDILLLALSVPAVYIAVHAVSGNLQPMLLLVPLVILPLCLVDYRILIFLTISSFVFSSSILRWSFPQVLVLRWLFLSLFVLRLFFDTAISSKLRIQLTAMHAFFILFFMVALLSSSYSISFSVSFQRATSWILIYIAVFFGFWRYLSSMERVYETINILLITVGIISVLSIVFYFLPGQPVFMGFRFRGIAQNPNTLGNFLAMLLPLLLWKRESLQNNTRNWHFIGLSILVVVVLILVSGSLTACGSALIGSGFFYFFMLKKNSFKRFLYILVVIFTFIFMMYYALIPTELRELIALKSHQSFVIGSGRWEAWSGALESFHKRPVLGYGFGTYDLLFERFNLTSDLRFGEVSSHNSYLDLLTGNGLIGVIAFLPLFLSLLSLVFKKGVNREDPEITLLAIALSGSVFAYLFTTSMFESSFFSAGNIFTFPFWLLVVTLNKVKNTNLNRPAIRNLICAE